MKNYSDIDGDDLDPLVRNEFTITLGVFSLFIILLTS